MPRTPHDDELESGSINLLPDEMRVAEERDRKSSRSNESSYQLRAPKKERKRRRAFAWLPFFGGAHWETAESKTREGAATSVNQQTPQVFQPEAAPLESSTMPSSLRPEMSPIVPISDEKQKSPSPKAFRSFKKGFSFPGLPSWLGGKRKKVLPIGRPAIPSVRSQVEMPARHYSLLSDEQQPGGVRPTMEGSVQRQSMPTISGIEDVGMKSHVVAMESEKAAAPKQTPKMRRGMRWPRWLDIFYLIKLMTAPGSHRVSHENVVMKRQKVELPRMPSLPAKVEQQSQNGQRPAPISPLAFAVEKQKIKRKFSFPRWLSIFSWFRFSKKTKKIEALLPPRPVTPLPAPPREIRAPVTPFAIPSLPVPDESHATLPASMPPAVPQPRIQVDALNTSREPLSTQKPVPPAAPTPITPIIPEPEGKEHRGRAPMKQDKQVSGFHLPGKLGLEELAMQFKDVNLIPGEYSMRSWRSIVQSLGVAVIAVAALTAISYILLNVEESRIKSRTAEIDSEIQNFKNDILFYKAQEPVMTSIGTRIDLIKQLLGTHIYWTNFFALLEKYTLPDVHYDGVSATPSGKLSLSAHGTNFETVTRALRLLSSADAAEFVSSVAITGAHQSAGKGDETRVDFVIELTLNPDLFYYKDGQK